MLTLPSRLRRFLRLLRRLDPPHGLRVLVGACLWWGVVVKGE